MWNVVDVEKIMQTVPTELEASEFKKRTICNFSSTTLVFGLIKKNIFSWLIQLMLKEEKNQST